MVLGKNFFKRPTLIVAKNLLGKFLARRIGSKKMRYLITEVEAYDGFKDKASHASKGLTKRNAPMFGEAGRWYVYFTYGMHWMLNIVAGPKNYPAAILIRGFKEISGPAKITKKLKIDERFNNKIALPKTGLWIENNSKIVSLREIPRRGKNCKLKIVNLPRIGVAYAGPIWSKKPWRFVLINVDKNV